MATTNDENETVDVLYARPPYIVYEAEMEVEYFGGRYEHGYAVQNSETGVVEFQSPSLPECMQFATNGASAIAFFMSIDPTPEVRVVSTDILEGEPA